MPELEPITREEKFLNGEVGMTPITREEKILAGEDIETVTRREYFLKKYRGGGGDVTVVPLSVTENGTYSEEGKAYSPVSVNVPLPQNAYLLKSVANLPQPIASFNDGADAPMKSLKVAIEPIQEGSGDPSPTNVRPISGWTECNVSVCGTNVWDEEWEHKKGYSSGSMLSSNTNIASKNYISCKPSTAYYFKFPSTLQIYVYQYDSSKVFIKANAFNSSESLITESNTAFLKFASKNDGYSGDYNNDISINYPSTDTEYHAYNGQTYTIDLDGTCYGGEVDVVSGELVDNRVFVTYTGDSSEVWGENRSGVYYISVSEVNELSMCNIFKVITPAGTSDTINDFECRLNRLKTNINFRNDSITSLADWKTWLSNNPIQLVYELATPLTIQLTPTAVKSLLGSNNVWADTGDITDAEYFSKEV